MHSPKVKNPLNNNHLSDHIKKIFKIVSGSQRGASRIMPRIAMNKGSRKREENASRRAHKVSSHGSFPRKIMSKNNKYPHLGPPSTFLPIPKCNRSLKFQSAKLDWNLTLLLYATLGIQKSSHPLLILALLKIDQNPLSCNQLKFEQ
jgi:hypothetical protein